MTPAEPTPRLVDGRLVVLVPVAVTSILGELVDRAHRQWVHRGGMPIEEAEVFVEACQRAAALDNLGMFPSEPLPRSGERHPADSSTRPRTRDLATPTGGTHSRQGRCTAAQAAGILGVTVQQVRRLCARGDLDAE